MNERELFLEGHKELINIMKWIGKPVFYIPKDSGIELSTTEHCSILFGDAKVGEGIEVIPPIKAEVYKKLIETFCESHLRLSNGIK